MTTEPLGAATGKGQEWEKRADLLGKLAGLATVLSCTGFRHNAAMVREAIAELSIPDSIQAIAEPKDQSTETPIAAEPEPSTELEEMIKRDPETARRFIQSLDLELQEPSEQKTTQALRRAFRNLLTKWHALIPRIGCSKCSETEWCPDCYERYQAMETALTKLAELLFLSENGQKSSDGAGASFSDPSAMTHEQ